MEAGRRQEVYRGRCCWALAVARVIWDGVGGAVVVGDHGGRDGGVVGWLWAVGVGGGIFGQDVVWPIRGVVGRELHHFRGRQSQAEKVTCELRFRLGPWCGDHENDEHGEFYRKGHLIFKVFFMLFKVRL